jgi:chemotaxis protein MotB
MSDEEASEQLIVRRRRVDSEEDHHGGVWKLAFADFMTAMMAFFLVMWLINSTSKETKATIVQYFNPVQLADSSPNQKGLRDPKDGGQGSSIQKSDAPTAKGQGTVNREAALHQEPMKALDEIAKIDPPPAGPASNRSARDVLADPFDRAEQSAPPSRESAREAEAAGARGQQMKTGSEAAGRFARADGNSLNGNASEKGDAATADSTAEIRSALESALRQEASGSRGGPQFEVRRTDDGVLISLTDNADFSMFGVGSIEPTPQLVRILAQVGPVLAKQRGEVEIAGHTDARSYKSKSYDNWRLSSDRANMVGHMLVRGGLSPSRIAKISGHADHRLKTAKDPLAAVNRRIEILVRGARN